MHEVKEIARRLGAEYEGDGSLTVEGASEPAHAAAHQIAIALKPEFADEISTGSARVALMWAGADWERYNLGAAIFAPRPRLALSGLTQMLDLGQGHPQVVSNLAQVDPSAILGDNVSIGAFSSIGAGAVIGDNCVILSHVSIGAKVQLGAGSYLREGVKIGAHVVTGERLIAQPGAVIGSDGFSFVTEKRSGVENARATLGDQKDAETDQEWLRIHSLGSVHIGSDVEIGANSCIDAGTIRPTRIGNGVKMDNLVHIGHNVTVGEHTLLCGQVGIAGSSKIGRNVVLAGQTGVNDNIFIGDNVIAGGASKIFTNVPNGRVILGYPAIKMENHVQSYKALRRLPKLAKDVAALKKSVLK